jgi:hypothetical protein
MDIAKPNGAAEPTSASQAETPGTAIPVDMTAQSAPELPAEPAAAPAETPDALVPTPVEVTEPNEPSPEPVASGASVPENPETHADQPTEQPPYQQPTVPKGHKAPVVAIILAMIVCLALSGLIVYKFISSKKSNVGTTTSSNSNPTVAKPQASPADVDQTSSDVDQALNSVNDAADFSANAISDQSLGL